MKLLLVEDDEMLRSSMSEVLVKQHFVVEKAKDFYEAEEKISLYEYTLIILDLTLPGGDGLDLLFKLKKTNKNTPVLIISARNAVDDKVKGLDLGADDYLAKPFHLAEFAARVKSIIRRNNRAGADVLEVGNLKLFPNERAVYINDNILNLSKKEFDIISFFVERVGFVVSKESLAEAVWGDNIDQVDNYDFIYAQMKNVRKKLNEANSSFIIKSIYGFGYKGVVD